MPARTHAAGNDYRCAIQINQNGKYNVRIAARFGRGERKLPVYFLASSFDRAMGKLGEALQLLQKNEEKLWFWGFERSDDPNMAGEFLKEFGLKLDRRSDFPAKAASLKLAKEKPVPPGHLALLRRTLADSIAEARVVYAD